VVDFNKLIKPHVIKPVAERFCVRGIRTKHNAPDIRYVRCVFEFTKKESGWTAVMVEGGVTGFESFTDSAELDVLTRGWTACFGTRGSWDKLEIEAAAMTALVGWIKEKINGT